MTALALTLTAEGIAAAVNAAHTGTGPIVLSQIALLSGPTTEIKRIATLGGDSVADNIIHVTITDETADTYTLRGLRLITDSGIIFATYSQATPILEKGAEQLVLLSADIVLTSVPAGSVTLGGTGFAYPPATTIRQGVIEIATDAEVQTGTDTTRAVTPAGLQAAASSNAPQMDGTAIAGTAKRWARADHVHPSDTAKVSRAGDILTGQLASTKSNTNPSTAANYAWRSIGSYGGGWVLQDGADNIGLFSVGGDLCFGFGADGLIAAKAYIAKTGEGYFGTRVITRDATEAQLIARAAGQPDAGLISNASAWGIYSTAGGYLVSFERATGKRYVAGIDTATLVLANGATYSISINGSAYYATSAGNAGTLAGMGAGYYTDIPARLGYTPVQQGNGAGQANNAVKIGWSAGGTGWLRVQVDNIDFGNTWPINITGNAATASNASNADALTGLTVTPGSSYRLPGGHVEKWGTYYIGDVTSGPHLYTITFPLAFPSACDNVQLTLQDTLAGPAVAVDFRLVTVSQGSFTAQVMEHGDATQNLTLHWTAKGR